MSKVRFQIDCPGCGDSHFAIECKKPSRFSPTVTKVKCDECEGIVLLRATLPKEKNGQVNIQHISILPSEKLIAIWEAHRVAVEANKSFEEASRREARYGHHDTHSSQYGGEQIEDITPSESILVPVTEPPTIENKVIEEDHSFLP